MAVEIRPTTDEEGWSVDEALDASAAAIEIVPIADAHMCVDTADFYRLRSRMTMARLFRKYIELSFRTPTEMLHNHRALQKMQAYGSLFSSGVDRVAVLQGNVSGQPHERRRDALYDMTEIAVRRARQAAEIPKMKGLKGFDLGAALDSVVGIAPAGQERFYASVVLAETLIAGRDWLGKFKQLSLMVGDASRDDVLEGADQMVADLMCIPSAFQEIMGFQRHLAQTLCTIADLIQGVFLTENAEASKPLAVFLPLIAQGRMPQTSEALIDRLVRQLGSTQPLNRHDPGQEKEAFGTVAARLKTPDGMMGGAAASEAMAQRAQRLFGPAGAPPLNQPPTLQAEAAEDRSTLLAGLADGAANTQEFPAGSRIFKEGELGESAYMVLAGSVEICTTYKGKDVMLARLKEGSIFGEMALFNARPRSASAVTVSGCKLRVIDKGEMDNRVESLDTFSRHWVSYLISRITDLSGRVAESGSGERK